jgi:hypothetical protein
MCGCPLHDDYDAACTCQCDHDAEQARETLIIWLFELVPYLDPELVKRLAAALREEGR